MSQELKYLPLYYPLSGVDDEDPCRLQDGHNNSRQDSPCRDSHTAAPFPLLLLISSIGKIICSFRGISDAIVAITNLAGLHHQYVLAEFA